MCDVYPKTLSSANYYYYYYYYYYCYYFFILWRCDPTQVMASSFLRFLDHTQDDPPHSVGLLWTSDQLVAKTST
jgi:hypothetical protein